MSEGGIISLFVLLAGGLAAISRALYQHVRECRTVHEKLGRIMEHLGIEDTK